MGKVREATRVAGRLIARLGALGMVVMLAACVGSTGAPGPAGAAGPGGPAGPPGPSSTVSALDVSTATKIVATITKVTIPSSGQPLVDFTLVDQNGQPLSGLPAADVSFAIARLVPAGAQLNAYPGLPAPVPLLRPQWQSYLYDMVNPAPASAATTTDPVVGTTAEPQATTEAGTAGTLVDNGNGSYQYEFKKDIETDPVVSYDASYVHRAGLEIRNLAPANSPVYTFIPASGATTGFDANDAVANTQCLACHQQLAFHGGARTSVQYCVICHNPSSIDPSSGNPLDFSVMIHKIHMGVDLPSVVAGTHYYIFGFRNSINDFSDVVYPQSDLSNNNGAVSGSGTRFCTTCHAPNDPDAPQSGDYQTLITAATCASCHDNIDFATGQGHGGIVATDAQCSTCHGPTAGLDNGALQVAAAHALGVDGAANKFAFKIVSVANTAPGDTPSVTLEVIDPENNDSPYDILASGGPFQLPGANLTVDMAWPTTGFQNIGSNSATAASGTPNQPVSINFLGAGVTNNGNGTFTAASSVPIPSTASGSGQMAVEGRAVVALPNVSGSGTTNVELGIAGVTQDFAITDPAAVAPAQIVSITKCDVCHHHLTEHGQNRTDNLELCEGCHNPDATDAGQHVAASGLCAALGTAGANPEQSIDFAVLIHEIHASGATDSNGNLRYPNGLTICSYGARATTFDVAFPGNLSDCNACHVNTSYYPVSAQVQGPTIVSNNRTTLADDAAVSPNAAICSSCHTSQVAREHMIQNGGDFDAAKTATGALVSPTVETCALCHGPGGIADVAVMHDLADFPNSSD